MRVVQKYRAPSGREPFNEWFARLDWLAQFKIDAYVVRASLGAARRNIRALGGGIFEIRIDSGPGYRVYFGEENGVMVLLLGGDKKSQWQDIRLAWEYWRNRRAKTEKL